MKLISREKLEHIARRVLHYPLHDAEKDYFLTIVMKILTESAFSKDLVFKGGTAIHHCYLNQLRFSEDLDFTSVNNKLNIDDFRKVFAQHDLFELKKEFISKATIKIERLKYAGVLQTPNSIKVEIDKLQNVLLKPVRKQYINVWGIVFEVNVMDPVEICAEKIRACSDRFRYRDFYDLYMMVNVCNVNLNNSIKIVPQKEIRHKITKDRIIRNMEYSQKELSVKSDTVYYREEIKPNVLKKFFHNINLPDFESNT